MTINIAKLNAVIGSKAEYLPKTLDQARDDFISRAKETVVALREDEVRPYHPAPMARQQKLTKQFCVKIGYGGNNAYMPNPLHKASQLCDRACAVLASLGPKAQGPVFTYRGKPIKSIKTAFNCAREKARLPDVRFHDLRHTFASRLVQGGVSLYEVMHMTGHKSLAVVQRYSHLAPDYQEGPIQVLNRLGHNLGTVDGSRKDGRRLSD